MNGFRKHSKCYIRRITRKDSARCSEWCGGKTSARPLQEPILMLGFHSACLRYYENKNIN